MQAEISKLHSQSSSLLQCQFPADVGVTNRRPSSDSELISRMEMRLLACVTGGPSRDPYQTVSTVFHIRYFENGPLEPGSVVL